MRRLVLPLLLLVSACDSGPLEDAGGDPVVGTWRAVELADEVLLTSRVDQSVPNLRARGEGGIVLEGALDDRLHYVSSLYRHSQAVDGVYAESITFVSRPGFDVEDGPYTILLVDVSATPAAATVNRVTPGAETYFDGLVPAGTGPFSYRDGRPTVPTVEVAAEDGSGRRVTVGGTLAFPVVELQAGQETALRTSLPVEQSVAFGPGGGYTQTGAAGTSEGRWRRDGADVVVTVGTGVIRFAADLDGCTLRLRFEEPTPAACVESCVSSTEANLFAEPGSISSVRYAGATLYRRAD